MTTSTKRPIRRLTLLLGHDQVVLKECPVCWCLTLAIEWHAEAAHPNFKIVDSR